MSTEDEEIYSFSDDDIEDASAEKHSQVEVGPWKVLMVDDSPEVHQVTRMVLRGIRFLDRPVELISGFSGEEGRRLVALHTDAAVIFLDVVMESDHAGLDMVKYIREECCNKLIRIILRTGQPGQAPEADVIQLYDINDYKNKADLSDDHLRTSLIVALRSYNDLITIEESRRGLEWILRSSTELAKLHSTEMFLSGLLRQLQAMFDFGQNAILCARSKPGSTHPVLPEPKVLAGSGVYEHLVGFGLEDDSVADCKHAILSAFESGQSVFGEENFSLYFYSRDVFEIVIVLQSPRVPTDYDKTLINVFCNTAAVSLSNINLMENLEKKVDERTEELNKANHELQVMASTDLLTNVNNRRSLFELGEEQLRVARRYKRDASLIIIDVDYFKRINDSYGHSHGDVVLQSVATVCKKLLRNADIFGRYGGEEFVAVCPETNLEGAMILAERLRYAIEHMTVVDVPTTPVVTISLGVTSLNSGDTEISDVINRADRALYQAKSEGRNKAICRPI